MTYRHINARNLSYSEFLAMLPWVLLRPKDVPIPERCQTRTFGTVSKPCKVEPRLIYMSLTGETSFWCHHHLSEVISEDRVWNGSEDPEVQRCRSWWKTHERAAFTEKRLPLEDVDYLRHLKVNEKRCDIDPNDLDYDERVTSR